MSRASLALLLLLGHAPMPRCDIRYRLLSKDGTRVYAEIVAPIPVRDCVFSFGAK